MGQWLQCKMFDCPSLFALELELKVLSSCQSSLSRARCSLSLANSLAASPGSLQTIKQQK